MLIFLVFFEFFTYIVKPVQDCQVFHSTFQFLSSLKITISVEVANSVSFFANGLHQVFYHLTYLHVYLPTVVDINLFKCLPENEARFQKLVLKVRPEIFFTDVSPILLFRHIANIPEQLFFISPPKNTQPTPRYFSHKSLKSIHPLHQPSSPTNILLRSQIAKLPYYMDRFFCYKAV